LTYIINSDTITLGLFERNNVQKESFMPDILYKIVRKITQYPRLVEVSTVTTETVTTTVNPDGTHVPQKPQIKTEIIEKWSVKAWVDTEYVGEAEEEFFFPTEAACGIIHQGYRRPF
jgi:hypothetical protein